MKDAEFERIVERHAQDVYAFLAYRTGDHHLAEDLLADTLERAYRARGRFDRRRASEKTWLISIALNRWRDVIRRETSERTALARLGRDEPHSDGTERRDERRALMEALGTLATPERDVVTLVYGAGLTAKQVASVLDEPVTTVQGRLYRGLARLKDELG